MPVILLCIGVAWPNPGCPVMMVECEHGIEEKSLGGQITLSKRPTQNPAAAQGSSFFNRQEAILAIRHVSLHAWKHVCLCCMAGSFCCYITLGLRLLHQTAQMPCLSTPWNATQ